MNEDNSDDDTQSSLASGSSLSTTQDNQRNVSAADEDSDDDFFDAALSLLLAEGVMEDDLEKYWGGSRPGKAPNKHRDFEGAANRLIRHYFSGDNSTYSEVDFKRRFRMERDVFQRIYTTITGDGMFAQRYDCTNKIGIHPLVRLTACLRVLMYGSCADLFDESFEIAESTLLLSVKAFCTSIIEHFGTAYLNRPPNEQELERILAINHKRGFPGLVASWDCKHFQWKNCPVYLAGQYTGKGTAPTVVLEAICDADLFIYYSFFGLPGSLNDINILSKSTILSALLSRQFDLRTADYTINGNARDWLYFLVDGIYPPWSIFMSTIPNPINDKERKYKERHEAVRKDIERAFGTLVQQFQILKQPFRSWSLEDNITIVNCCIIIHNMIVESRRYLYSVSRLHVPIQHGENNQPDNDQVDNGQMDNGHMDNDQVGNAQEENDNPVVATLFGYDAQVRHNDYDFGLAATILHSNFTDCIRHRSLKNDLVEHIWSNVGTG